MKKLIVALALAAAAGATPVLAGDLGISVSIGEPGFYGQLVIGDVDRPRLVVATPVVVVESHRHLEPIYVRVPDSERRHWARYCGRYNACARPVYFVRDDWYRNEYAPRYRKEHGYDKNGNNGHRNGKGHDKDHGKGHDRGHDRDD